MANKALKLSRDTGWLVFIIGTAIALYAARYFYLDQHLSWELNASLLPPNRHTITSPSPPPAAFRASASLLPGEADASRLPTSLECLFYDPPRFARSVREASPYPLTTPLLAGVVPHHLVADRYIASFFATVAETAEAYTSVLLLGPNHSGKTVPLVTSQAGFNTPYGYLANNIPLTQGLLEHPQLKVAHNPALIQEDHSLAALVPYVKYYLPQVTLGTLLLSNDLSLQECFILAQHLAQLEETLVVASIDFSHYLTPQEAAMRDLVTLKAIKQWDYPTISQFTDAHVDSPESLITILYLAELHHVPNLELWEHSEASLLENAPLPQGTTSYFILAAPRP